MPDDQKTIRVDRLHPDPVTMKKAGKILSSDGVVIFPAQCLYGVAANALSPPAVQKVFKIKQRPGNNPILVLIKDFSHLSALVKTVPDPAQILMDRFWPGGLTLVFRAADTVLPQLTAHTGKIGIRIPGHPVARALVNAVDFPITGTSANISGRPGGTRPDCLDTPMAEEADLILDAGPVRGGKGSTIVDVTCTPVAVLRQGAVSEQALLRALA